MRRCFITGFVALAPLAGVMLFAVRDSRAQQPMPPSKNAAPNDVAPRNEPQPPQAQNPRPNDRDISPREQNPAQRDRDAVRERDASHDRDAIRERDPRDVAGQPGAKEERPEGNRQTQRERRSDRDLGITFGHVTERGLAVNNLTSNSALVRAGLRAGDVIVSVGGHRLERAEDFDRFVYETGTTDRIKVIVFRGGREEVVYLEPTIFYAEPSYVDDFSYFGVVLDDRNPDRLIVQRVYPDSPAFIAGIRVGDEITTFHGKRVGNRAELARMLHGIEPGKVDLEFSHNGRVVRSEAKFNERVAARDRTNEGRNDRQPTDNGNQPQQPGRQPGQGVTPNQPVAPNQPGQPQQPGAQPRPQAPMQPNAPQQPGAQPGAAPGGQSPAPPHNLPGGRQPMPPNQPSGPNPGAGPANGNGPSAGPNGQQPSPPRNQQSGPPPVDR